MFQSHFLPEVIQVDGCFHITRERNDDGIYPLKPPYHPALLHVALKIPTPTQEPGLFIFGTKCQKVASLEASELFAFLQLYYLSLPSWSIVCIWSKKRNVAKSSLLFLLPSCHIFHIFMGCSSPSSSCSLFPAPQCQLAEWDLPGKHCLFLVKGWIWISSMRIHWTIFGWG